MDKIGFLGIGAAKSGTTWLAQCINEHPEIYMPPAKELCFFHRESDGKDNFSKGLKWFNKHFEGALDHQLCGEYTNHYLFSDNSAELIHSYNKDIKLIVCLRNPIDMIYSLYWWYRSTFNYNSIPDNFEEVLESPYDYIKYGMYYQNLKKYYSLFDKKNIYVLLFEDIKADPKGSMKKVYEFLGVDDSFIPPSLKTKVNNSAKVRSKTFAFIEKGLYSIATWLNISTDIRVFLSRPTINYIYEKLTRKSFKYPVMSRRTRQKLIESYKSDILALEKIIGRDLSHWREK